MTEQTTRGPGRPRQELIPQVLDAVNELIAEDVPVTVNRVVERSGVSRAAIYRRFASTTELIAAALDQGRSPVEIPSGMSTREALEYSYVRMPADQRYGSGLGAQYSERRFKQRLVLALADPDLQREYWNSHVSRRRTPILEILKQGQASGEVRPEADLDAAIDLLSGVYYYQAVVRGEGLSDPDTLARCAAAVEIIWQGIKAE